MKGTVVFLIRYAFETTSRCRRTLPGVPIRYGALSRRILLIRIISILAMAITALLAPFKFFSFLYLFLIHGSFVIRIQLPSTAHVLTRLFPHRVILP